MQFSLKNLMIACPLIAIISIFVLVAVNTWHRPKRRPPLKFIKTISDQEPATDEREKQLTKTKETEGQPRRKQAK